MSEFFLTDEEFAALDKRGKAGMELRARKTAHDAQLSAIVQRCPCDCGFLVRHSGLDPKTKLPHKTYVVRQSPLSPAILKCSCTLADSFGKLCSHVMAIQLLQEQAGAAQEPQTTTAQSRRG